VTTYELFRNNFISFKIKAAANPYLPEYARYYRERRHKKGGKELPTFYSFFAMMRQPG